MILMSAILSFARAGQAVFGILIVVVISRAMEASALAVVLVLTSITLNAGLVGVLGFDIPLVKVLGREEASAAGTREQYASLSGRFVRTWIVLFAVSTLVGVIILPHGSIPALLGVPLSWVVLWIFMASVQVFQSSVLLGCDRKLSSVFSFGAISNLITLVILTFTMIAEIPLDVRTVALAYGAGLAVSLTFAQIQIHRTIGWIAPRLRTEVADMTSADVSVGELARSAAMNALGMISTQFPFWVVATLGSASQVVSFGLAFRFIIPLVVVLLAARTQISPLVARAWHEGRLSRAEPQMRAIATVSFVTAAVIGLVLLGLRTWIFESIFVRDSAGTFCPVALMVGGQAILAYFGQGLLVLRITDRAVQALTVSVACASVQALLAPFLFWGFGIAGAAAAAALYSFSMAFVPNLLVRRAHDVRIHAGVGCAPQLRNED